MEFATVKKRDPKEKTKSTEGRGRGIKISNYTLYEDKHQMIRRQTFNIP